MFKITKIPGCALALALLVGCQSQSTLKLSPETARTLGVIDIAAVEAPPLQVIPDLLAKRMPNIAHAGNMVLPVMAEDALYLNPGDILIAGKVGYGDVVEVADLSRHWRPTEAISEAVAARLTEAGIDAHATARLTLLFPNRVSRDVYLVHWHDAIENWYASDIATPISDADAVLEIGIGDYRVFANQIRLQILIKLIDVHSGRILARADKQVRLYDVTPAALFNSDGARFKALIREYGAKLALAAAREIGLMPQHLSRR